jgi:Ca-activated chloride channel homolog
MKGLVVVVGLIAAFLYFFLKTPAAPPPVAKPSVAPAAAAQAAKRMTPAWPPSGGESGAVSADLFAKNYYVVLDGSGSMGERGCSGAQSKMEAAKAALAVFAGSLPAQANLGLQVFDARGVREWLPLGTRNREQFTRLVNEVRANAGTPLREAVSLAYAKLLAQGAKQLGYGEYHLVIVTDGVADQGQDPTAIVNKMLNESPVVVQTIGFCIGAEHSLNQAGRTIYRAAENAAELGQGLADVLAEAPQFAVTQFK